MPYPCRFRGCWLSVAIFAAIGFSGYVQAEESSDTLLDSPPTEIVPLDEAQLAELQALIDQLGDESFESRETAMQEIMAIGLAALPLVEENTAHDDPEVRYRCERLKTMLRDADLQRRLEAFAADVVGKYDHGLPAWDRFAELHGSGAESRRLFVEIFQTEAELLKTLQLDAERASEVAAARVVHAQQLQRVKELIPEGTIAALLFAAGSDDVPIQPTTRRSVYSLCSRPEFREALTAGPHRESLRSLLGRFILLGDDATTASQALSLAMLHDLDEGLIRARTMVEGKPGTPHVGYVALFMVARKGDLTDLARIAKHLDDRRVVMNMQSNNVRYQGQLRDFAVVAAAHLLVKDGQHIEGTPLEKGDIKELGFARLQNHATYLYTASTIGFPNEEEREEVFQKWEEVRAKLPPELLASEEPADEPAE
jgi:hypothetical protein